MGILASILFDHASPFAESGYGGFKRQLDDPPVRAWPLFQSTRGVQFGGVFYLLQGIPLWRNRDWLITRVTLAFVGVFSTFGPAAGSIEGMINATFPATHRLGGLVEFLV